MSINRLQKKPHGNLINDQLKLDRCIGVSLQENHCIISTGDMFDGIVSHHILLGQHTFRFVIEDGPYILKLLKIMSRSHVKYG